MTHFVFIFIIGIHKRIVRCHNSYSTFYTHFYTVGRYCSKLLYNFTRRQVHFTTRLDMLYFIYNIYLHMYPLNLSNFPKARFQSTYLIVRRYIGTLNLKILRRKHSKSVSDIIRQAMCTWNTHIKAQRFILHAIKICTIYKNITKRYLNQN